MQAIRLHGGGAHIKGKASRWTYHVASLFETKLLKSGKTVWVNTGQYVGPFLSKEKTRREASDWAAQLNCRLIEGYGSLHNTRYFLDESPPVDGLD